MQSIQHGIPHFCALFIIIMGSFEGACSQNDISDLVADIRNGPQWYYTSEAYSYFTRKGKSLPPQSPREKALSSYKATVRIAAMGSAAIDAIPVLLETFPRAVHVTEIANIRYGGEGTFEDWVQTYVTNEKNKFILSPVFLEYSSISVCDPFVTNTFEITRDSETVTGPTREPVTISVTHTIHFGACALSGITGENLGIDPVSWQQWWNDHGTTFKKSPPPPPASVQRPALLRSGQSFGDITLHGKYRITLSTSAILSGRIEAKDDTSLVLESDNGKAYTFKPHLIDRYELLEPPRVQNHIFTHNDSLPFSYDELRGMKNRDRQLEVRINSGVVFRGLLEEIDAVEMKLKVGNSSIPISRDVVLNIRFVPLQQKKTAIVKTGTAAQRDTVFVKNTETDDWGKPKADLVYTGTIEGEQGEFLTMTTPDAEERKIPRKNIIRIVKNSDDGFQAVIKKYAAPLFCPDDMFLVDVPPGKPGRPFFKVCVDRYEYPNIAGTIPNVNVSYDEARLYCKKRGKRLCTTREWEAACGGIEGYTYPYGWNPEKDKCNTGDTGSPEQSGARHNCVSKFGGYDMTGNVFEWVTDTNNQPSLMGGPHSKCQTLSEGVGGSPKPRSGLRCCKSN